MEPTIKTGSLVFVRPGSNYSVGDIITFKNKLSDDIKNPKLTTTHRINSIEEKDGSVIYATKGDANNAPDLSKTSKDLVLGKVVFMVPYLGYPVGYAKTQTGFVVLIVIPATIIVYSELMNIKEEAKRLVKERAKRKLTPLEKIEVVVGVEEIYVEKGLKRFFKRKHA
jgi:signal peptidase